MLRLVLLALALAVTGPVASARAAAITFSTYLGGSGDEASVYFGGIVAVAVDELGNRYVTGATRSTDFPTTAGAGKQYLSGDVDIFVAKIAPGGTVLYSTYLGGPCDDTAVDIAVDANGDAYITGRVHGGVCLAPVNASALVAKLDAGGAVVWSTGLGGSLADTSTGQAIAVDAAGRAYVAGVTSSSSRDFPTTPGAFRTSDCAGGWAAGGDGFVARLSPGGGVLEYSTFLCGTAHESPNGIAVDAAGHAYVVGSTESEDFPTFGAIQPAKASGPSAVTGFLTKLLPDGSGVAWSTYLGGSTNDIVADVALDAAGNAYVTGETQSDDFPTTAGVVQPRRDNSLCVYTLCSDVFVTKVDANGALAYSTLLFGEGNDAGTRVDVDALGNAYVVGSTASRFFPVVGAFQPATRGAGDAFVAKLDPAGARLLYSSYLGGSPGVASPLIGADGATGLAVDWMGNAHVGGYTLSFDFPTTANAVQPALAGGVCDVTGTPCGDAFVTMIWADGPRTVPPIDLVTTPVAPDGTVTATWHGIPAPTTRDELRLYRLGSYGGNYEELASWSTDGWSDAVATLTLPPGLEAGWYELRLLNPDPESNLLAVIARSEPIGVGTGTPIGPTPTCGTGCDDGDACTVDVCVEGRVCVSTPPSGFASVTCTCGRPAPAACAGERLPRAIDRRRRRLCSRFERAATKAVPPVRKLRRDVGGLDQAMRALARARAKGRLSSECATSLDLALRDTRDRASRLLRSL